MTTQNTATTPDSPGLLAQAHRWIFWLKITVYSVVALLVLILLAEAYRLYTLTADIHPLLGYLTIMDDCVEA